MSVEQSALIPLKRTANACVFELVPNQDKQTYVLFGEEQTDPTKF